MGYMAAIPAALAWIGAGLGLGQLGATDGLLDNLPKRKQQQQQQQQPVQPIYHISTGGGSFGLGSLFTAAAIGGGVVVFFGAYKYFWGANPLDKIIPELEESSRKTLDQVRKADENQAVRAHQIDENNKIRLQQLRSEIQGEQRGNFEVLSEQIACLTQIALQTMTHTTPGGPAAITNGQADEHTVAEYNKRKDELHQWAAEAQKVVDEISDPNYHDEKRKEASRRIRATIPNFGALTDGTDFNNQSSDLGGVHDLRVKSKDDDGRPHRKAAGSGGVLSGTLGYFFS